MASVIRNSEWVRREYGEEKWPAVLQEIESYGGPGERFVHEQARGDLGLTSVRLGDSVLELPRQFAVGGYLSWVASSVAEHAKHSDLVIELGAGWGRNLLLAWMYGSNPTAQYIAGEFTAAGRRAANALAERTQGFDMTAVEFDYHSPNLDRVQHAGRATIFTAHSIEQIPHVSRDVIDVMRAIADDVTIVNFEPVGWQIRGNDMSPYADKHDYNRNFWGVLSEVGAQVLEVDVDVVGLNPDNPTSKIVWK